MSLFRKHEIIHLTILISFSVYIDLNSFALIIIINFVIQIHENWSLYTHGMINKIYFLHLKETNSLKCERIIVYFRNVDEETKTVGQQAKCIW